MTGQRIAISLRDSQMLAEYTHGFRILQGTFSKAGPPGMGSQFEYIDQLYPFEKASEWSKSYLSAALEQMLFWADVAVPERFDPTYEVVHTFRPIQTLARSALA